MKKIFNTVVEKDKSQFGHRHKEFADDPYMELLHGLEILSTKKLHEDRYKNFLGPLVYNANSPSWDESIKSLKNLADILLK